MSNYHANLEQDWPTARSSTEDRSQSVVGPDVAGPQLVRLARNSAANLLRLAAGWLILLVVPPLLVRMLDRSAYATWMLVLQIGAYATFFDGGLQLAVGRYVARAARTSDRRCLAQVLSSATLLFLLAAGLVCIAAMVIATHLGTLFSSIPAAILPQAREALLLIGLSIGLALPFSVLAGYCLGLEKNPINALAGGVSKIAGASGILWAAFHHQGLARMALWMAGGILLQPLIYVFATRRFGVVTLVRVRAVSLRLVSDFARFCSATMASQFSDLLITGLDLPIVAAFDFRNTGYYAVAALMSNMLVVPFSAILSTMVPMMSAMTAGATADRMGQVLLRTTRLAIALLALAAVPLMAGMPVLLRLWVGGDYARHALLLGELLMAAQLVRLTLMPYTLIGFSAGEQHRMLASPVGEGLVNLASSLVLVRVLGAAGVAVGTLIGACVGIALHFLVSMRRTRSMSFRRRNLIRRGILPPLAWALPPTLLLVLILPRFLSTPGKLLVLGAGVIILGLLFWNGHLTSEERMALRGLPAGFFPSRLRPKPTGA